MFCICSFHIQIEASKKIINCCSSLSCIIFLEAVRVILVELQFILFVGLLLS